MRITGYSAGAVTPSQAPDLGSAVSPPSTGPAGGALQLSATGQLALSAREALRGVPEVREPVTKALGAQVAAGRYRADPAAIATTMIGD
jgi:hypothetical protein